MRRRSQRMDTVIILYFGTSFSSLSYVDCESRGRNTSGQYLRSSNVRAFASGHKRRETRRPLARSPLARSPLGASLRACTEPDRVLDGSPDATRDEIHAPVRRALGCWPSPSSSPWTISARTGKTTRRRRRRQSPSSSTEAHPSAGILRDVPSRDAFASIPRLHRPNARARTNPFRSFALASSSRPPRAPPTPTPSARVVVRVTATRPVASIPRLVPNAPWPSSYRRPKPWRPWRPSIRALSEASFVRVRRARRRGGLDRARATSTSSATARRAIDRGLTRRALHGLVFFSIRARARALGFM